MEINVVSNPGERKFGISSWNELPEQFENEEIVELTNPDELEKTITMFNKHLHDDLK